MRSTGTDLRQIHTSYVYDALGRLVEETAAGNVGATVESRTTTYQYDAVGNLVAQIDPLGRKSTSQYDRLDRLVKWTDPDPDGPGGAGSGDELPVRRRRKPGRPDQRRGRDPALRVRRPRP